MPQPIMSDTLSALCAIARHVAATEVMPRYQKVVAEIKHDGSLFTDKILKHAMASVETKWLSSHLATKIVTENPYHSHRNFGASTIDWCWLAAGRTDVMLHGAQKLWDYAAGVLILLESGGEVGSIHHADYWQENPWHRSAVVARTSSLYIDWQAWVQINK